MDIELARTFLTIVETEHFGRAAKKLNVTQTTVSARIHSLEEQLQQPLFVRNKSGSVLTPAGERFLKFARTLVQVWERARHQVSVPDCSRTVFRIGSELSLWSPLLLNWMVWIRSSASDIALQTRVDLSDALLRHVTDGRLDLALVHAPRLTAGLRVELVIREKLVFVTTDPSRVDVCDPGYVFVDWGDDFAAHHGASFPHFVNSDLRVGLGPLGLDYIVKAGGSGYFRQSAVQRHLGTGRLRLVPNSPEFPHYVYAVFAENAERDVIGTALPGLRAVAELEWELDGCLTGLRGGLPPAGSPAEPPAAEVRPDRLVLP
ncbi:LysR family transcriptional regulator [Methylobacterium oxalidis]|uniref:LysR family transcriptional regulator n=1 Tax=Methylobacterium oxalidis TaxID=944322 RepID=A0A512JBH8_9HYPH|nr:LysR family transcriptional regulator [Methylobacterium oxalidis]GEP07333.1 LysR family transcriptional regulator [Methylobacterium oxalidis]GJE35558.1 HTH-type transcriptional regulator HdfR [Methylobacterium oxalidis]GLS64473.1 LysR family transcriptional regulator [Methylobacterium oxalidis]